ncbi:MAG: beta-lactamase family protein [Thermomicrobiales bacterium]|nr:beta-lactamase family protein [Thermomicrobiales bacterium]
MPETMSEFSIADQLTLHTIVQRGMATPRVPGVIAGVWAGSAGWTTAQGIADLRTAEPMMLDGHVRIASVSKTFVATVLLQLIAEGRATLDDVLEQYVPGVPNGDRIRLRHLLGMTGGIFNFINDPEFEPAYTSDPLIPFTREFFLELLRRNPPKFAPGAGVEYSDSNYFLLGMIIEALTGRSAAQEIDERIVQPLGLTGTSLPDSPAMPSPAPRGYAASAGSPELRDLTESSADVPWTAGAMISTLADLRVWSRALATGALLTPEMQQERLRILPLSFGDGAVFGYGLGIMEWQGWLGHAGAIFGYGTWMLHHPEKDATVIVLANRGETEQEFAGAITFEILQTLFA